MDRHLLHQHLLGICWKLRGVLRNKAVQSPMSSNAVERAPGVKRANLPSPEDDDPKLEAMTVCEALELGINQLHKVGCALYIKHNRYSHAVVDSFLGDEYVRAERKQPLKKRMATSVKEV